MFRGIVTDDVAYSQNKEVTSPMVALCRGLYLQQTLRPVCSCLSCTMFFGMCVVFGTSDNRKTSYQVPPSRKYLVSSLVEDNDRCCCSVFGW